MIKFISVRVKTILLFLVAGLTEQDKEVAGSLLGNSTSILKKDLLGNISLCSFVFVLFILQFMHL
jgi:hypothetical protein